MRDWNSWNWGERHPQNQVLILPMRDWNYNFIPDFLLLSWFGFDLTYEGLKLVKNNSFSVLIWGFDLTYEGLKLASSWILSSVGSVLILPMRDWNSRWNGRNHSWTEVLILPMRDWNRYTSSSSFRNPSCFDLTYEGLKLHNYITFPRKNFLCFDLTYEGLKRWKADKRTGFEIRFDLTYEGLKLAILGAVASGIETRHWWYLLTVRLRFDLTYEGLKPTKSRGQKCTKLSFDLTYEGLKLKTVVKDAFEIIVVLILPMRDWNL